MSSETKNKNKKIPNSLQMNDLLRALDFYVFWSHLHKNKSIYCEKMVIIHTCCNIAGTCMKRQVKSYLCQEESGIFLMVQARTTNIWKKSNFQIVHKPQDQKNMPKHSIDNITFCRQHVKCDVVECQRWFWCAFGYKPVIILIWKTCATKKSLNLLKRSDQLP